MPSVIGGYSPETRRIRTRSGARAVGHLPAVVDGDPPPGLHLGDRQRTALLPARDADRGDLRPVRQHAVAFLAVDVAEDLVEPRAERQPLDPAAALPRRADRLGRLAVVEHGALHEQAGERVADADVDVRARERGA